MEEWVGSVSQLTPRWLSQTPGGQALHDLHRPHDDKRRVHRGLCTADQSIDVYFDQSID
jgi:hypothetical protein